jgi:hypothetical protein
MTTTKSKSWWGVGEIIGNLGPRLQAGSPGCPHIIRGEGGGPSARLVGKSINFPSSTLFSLILIELICIYKETQRRYVYLLFNLSFVQF